MPPTFLLLPRELRNIIYSHIFGTLTHLFLAISPTSIHHFRNEPLPRNDVDENALPIRFVCKQIYAETRDAKFRYNTFTIANLDASTSEFRMPKVQEFERLAISSVVVTAVVTTSWSEELGRVLLGDPRWLETQDIRLRERMPGLGAIDFNVTIFERKEKWPAWFKKLSKEERRVQAAYWDTLKSWKVKVGN